MSTTGMGLEVVVSLQLPRAQLGHIFPPELPPCTEPQPLQTIRCDPQNRELLRGLRELRVGQVVTLQETLSPFFACLGAPSFLGRSGPADGFPCPPLCVVRSSSGNGPPAPRSHAAAPSIALLGAPEWV